MRLAFAALVLMAQGAYAAKPVVPVWDCDLEIHEGDQGWTAGRYHAGWHLFTHSKAYIAASVSTYDAATRAALQRFGTFDPALRTSVVFAPQTAKVTKPLWVAVSVGNKVLKPMRISQSKGFYGIASIDLFTLEPLLVEASELNFTFHFADGTVFGRGSIPVSDFKQALDRFPALSREYEARVAAPEGVCVDHNDDSIVVN